MSNVNNVKRRTILGGVGGAALLLVLASAAADAAEVCPAPAPGSNPQLTAHLAEVNAFRASNGVAPLVLNDKLTAAAQGHAADMARKNYFSHSSLDGRTPAQRINAAGYTGWTAWGENIAWGYRDWHTTLVVWQNSASHRANLLSPRFKEIGLGAAVSPSGTRYWVQDFGARRAPAAPAVAANTPHWTGGIGTAVSGTAR